jgi:hypothetical protein
MVDESSAPSPSVHPLVRDLLAAGEGKTVAIDGYFGLAPDGRVRLYADLGLRTFIELAKSDIVRIVDSTETPQGPSVVYFKRDAEIAYFQTVIMSAEQALAAVLASPPVSQPGCGCGGSKATPGSIARQSGGGPVVDICSWACTERVLTCARGKGTFGKFWCYFNYAFCRFGCIDLPSPA